MTTHSSQEGAGLSEEARQVIAWDDGKGYPPAPSSTQRVAQAYLDALATIADRDALIASGRLKAMPSEEEIARLLAGHFGPGWDKMYQDKREWIDDRGSRQPDVNGPFRDDCTEAARAILALSDAKP